MREATSPRSTIGMMPATTAPASTHSVVRLADRSAGADDVLDQQHPRAGVVAQPESLDELLQAAGFGFLAHGEPRLAGDHRDADGERVGTHRQTTDRVELDLPLGGQVDHRPADDREPGAGVHGVLAVDVVLAGLPAGELEWHVAVLVAALDDVKCVLPGDRCRHRGNATADASSPSARK